MARWLLLISVCIGFSNLTACRSVGIVCENSGSTDECAADHICSFTRVPATFDPNDDPPPPLSVCLRKCQTSSDCGEGEVCRTVFCSNELSCQTGPLQEPPSNICGTGGTGGMGGAGGIGGMAGMGGAAGTGGTGGGALCDSNAIAFIKTIDPANNFNQTNLVDQVTTRIPDTWNRYTIELEIVPELVDQLLQVGFAATASNFAPSGVFYDNVVVEPNLQYTEDFESLDQTSPTALGDDPSPPWGDGWVVFGAVFSGTSGDFLFGYGTFPAPNGTDGFSSIALGEGGGDQGEQVLVIYSDYGNSAEQQAGNRVEASTFRERTITAADVGSTIVFSFDAKRGNINEGCPDEGTGGSGGAAGSGGDTGAGGMAGAGGN